MMDTEGNTILITGGSTGIGFAFAEEFIRLRNTVIICGKREDKLKEAKEKLTDVNTFRCDISKENERKALFDWTSSNFKNVNLLINNAGIQRAVNFKNGIEHLLKTDDEIEINFKAQIYISAYFVPLLLKQKSSAIINVSSGLGFIPMANFPIYCATKAAIHSFSLSLRQQLRETQIKVFELIPPGVYDTELKGKKQEKNDWSLSSKELVDATIIGLKNDEYEIAAGASKGYVSNSKNNFEQAFKNMNH
jgi:uncharacterized oxidoreductase